MEACDDIAYSIIDAEDTVKKGYASFFDLMDFLENESNSDPVIQKTIKKAKEVHKKEIKRFELSNKEQNDISMQMFRHIAIAQMVEDATATFVRNIVAIMNCEISPGFELISNSDSAQLCKACKNFDSTYGFKHKEVLKLELHGNNYIKNMMAILWDAINNEEGQATPFQKYVFRDISENYRRVYKKTTKTLYDKLQLLCDVVSGMTEKYLIKKHDEYRLLQNDETKN
jgi:dGTPase